MNAYTFYIHRECEAFPCHETIDPDNFNCIFCYCPLYSLGEGCGGKFVLIKPGVKDCSDCILPHKRENYGYVTRILREIAASKP